MSGEEGYWRTTCIILVIVSAVIGLIQRSSYQFLDTVFEVSIFHVPTVISIVIYLYVRRKRNADANPVQVEQL